MIDIRQVPVAHAKVQLRNLVNGTVQQGRRVGRQRRISSSPSIDPGTYVVEMVLVDGYVLALSNAGSLARFETLQTVVQLPGRWDASRAAW